MDNSMHSVRSIALSIRLAIRRNGTQSLYPAKRVPLWILTEPSAVIPRFSSDFGNVAVDKGLPFR